MKKLYLKINTILLAVVLVLLVVNLFSSRMAHRRAIRQLTDSVRVSINEAVNHVELTGCHLDSLEADLAAYTAAVQSVHKRLEVLEKDRKNARDKFLRDTKNLRDRMKTLRQGNDTTGFPVIIIE